MYDRYNLNIIIINIFIICIFKFIKKNKIDRIKIYNIKDLNRLIKLSCKSTLEGLLLLDTSR